MKTVFKIGMKVYDQVNFPDMEGIVEEIDLDSKYPITVSFGIPEYEGFYSLEGTELNSFKPTLSTKPYEVELKGFEQKAPAPTYEEAVKWCIKNLKDYRESVCTEYVNEKQENAIEALRKLIILRDYYNEGWQPDWKSDNKKYIIERYEDELRVIGIFGTGAILHFRKLNIAERFLEEQKKLLEIAKPLL